MKTKQINAKKMALARLSNVVLIAKSRLGSWFYVLMIVAFAGFGPGAHNSAAFQGISEPGIDLIILLDQSGSMSQPSDDAPPTDPDDLRIDATRYLIEYLAFDNSSVNPDRVNRVAVVGFGSPSLTELSVPLTRLDEEENVISAQNAVEGESFGATSFISALEIVREIFPEATDEELQSGQRRRMIVIVTDGGPADDRDLSYGEYFDEIKKYYDESLGVENFPLYVVGVDQFDRYWSDVEGRWEEAILQQPEEERVFRVEEIEEVRAKIVDFLCPFLGQSGTDRDCRLLDLGPHFVDPYANVVRFSFFKYNPDAQIRLYRPGDETPYPGPSSSSPVYGGGEETYEISYPEPGCWLSERINEGRVDVFQDIAFVTSLNLTQPEQPHSQLLPLALEFSVSDDRGVAIEEHPDYPVSFESVLISPDGTTQSVEVQKKVGVDGLYVSTNDLSTPLSGTYTVQLSGFVDVPEIVVTVENPDNPTQPLSKVCTEANVRELFSTEFEFVVSAPDLAVTAPIDEHLPYAPLMTLEIAATDGGVPLALQSGFWSADASLRAPSGTVINLPSPDLVNGRFEFTGPFVLNELGSYTVDLAASAPPNPSFYQGQAKLLVKENTVMLAPPPVFPVMTEVLTTTVQLRDMAGNAVNLDPSFPFRMEATLVGPDNRPPEVVRLDPITGTIGTYGAVAPWILERPGDYAVRLTGYIKTSTEVGAGEMLAFETEHVLTGSETLPYFRVAIPDQTDPSTQEFELHGRGEEPFYKSTPIEIHVQLLQNEQGADPDTIFKEPAESIFVADILAADGSSIGNERPMVLREDVSEPGLFTLLVDDLTEEGDYRVRVHLAGTLVDGSEYEGFLPDVVVPFRLYETDLYKASRIAAYVIAIILGLALIALVAWIVYGFLPPYPSGKLIAKELGVGGDELARMAINSGGLKHKKDKLSGKSIPARLQLDRIEVKRATPVQGRRRSSLIRSRPSTGPEEVIEIVAFSKSDKKHTVATGKLYSTRASRVPCSQLTDDGKQYEFRYER